MQTKTKEFEGGFVRYRLPNIPERMRLMGHMGQAAQSSDSEQARQFMMVAEALDRIGPLIEAIQVKDGERLVTTWTDALSVDSFQMVATELASEIMMTLVKQIDEPKKKESPVAAATPVKRGRPKKSQNLQQPSSIPAVQ